MDDFVTIKLFGDTYTFKAEDGVRNAKTVADFLVQEVEKVEKQVLEELPHATRFTTLLIAALNISNEYMALKQDYKEVINKIADRQTSLVEKIGRCIP